MVQPHHCLLTKRPMMSRFVFSLPRINTADLPCIPLPLRSSPCSPGMRSRSRPVSFTGTLVTLYRSIRYNASITSALRHQSRSRKLIVDRKFMPPKARQILGVDETSHPVFYPSFDLERKEETDSPSTETTTSTLCGTEKLDDHRLVEPPKPFVITNSRQNSAQSGVSTTELEYHAPFQLIVIWIVHPWRQNHGVHSA